MLKKTALRPARAPRLHAPRSLTCTHAQTHRPNGYHGEFLLLEEQGRWEWDVKRLLLLLSLQVLVSAESENAAEEDDSVEADASGGAVCSGGVGGGGGIGLGLGITILWKRKVVSRGLGK